MPTYDYICSKCDHEFETFQLMAADLLTDCPECGKPTLRRKIGTGAGLIFKGGGFYETDFKDKKGSKPETTTKTETKSETPTKPESKPVSAE